MGVEGVFISTREGRLCFYRNYGAIPHALFEDLAFAIPPALAVEQQKSFATHGPHRLVFLPLENLIIVLVTPKNSNIIEDIESVGNVKDVIHGILGGRVGEDAVLEYYNSLAFAFDDMVSLGMRNAFSKTQITALLEMESSNEKMQKAILLGKEKEAQKKTEEESREIEKKKKVQEILSKEFKEIDESIRKIAVPDSETPVKAPKTVPKFEPSATSEKQSGKAVKGLQLRPVGKQKDKAESKPAPAVKEEPVTKEEPAFNPLSEELEVALEERLTGSITTAGDWKNFELKGVLRLTQFNPKLEKWRLDFSNSKIDARLNIRFPPSFDKKRWGEGVLAFREGGALAPNQPTETLKYGFTASGSVQPPFKLTTWFSGNELSAEVEFNTKQDYFEGFDSFAIKLDVPDRLGATVSDYSGGEVFVEKSGFRWVIAPMDAENSVANIVIQAKKPIKAEDIFPAEIDIQSKRTSFRVENLKAFGADDRELKIKFTKGLLSKDLKIE